MQNEISYPIKSHKTKKAVGIVVNIPVTEFGFKNNYFNSLVEAPVGFEPTNKGFADLPLKPLGYSAI